MIRKDYEGYFSRRVIAILLFLNVIFLTAGFVENEIYYLAFLMSAVLLFIVARRVKKNASQTHNL